MHPRFGPLAVFIKELDFFDWKSLSHQFVKEVHLSLLLSNDFVHFTCEVLRGKGEVWSLDDLAIDIFSKLVFQLSLVLLEQVLVDLLWLVSNQFH